MTTTTSRRAGVLVGAVALVAPLGLLSAAPASALSRDTSRYSITAQGDAMFYEADSLNAPATPKNQAGSLTARVDTNSAGNSTAFAGAPYTGPTVTTVPGTATGLVGGLAGMPFPVPLPFTTLPGYVSSRYPTDPKGADDKGAFRVSTLAEEYGGTAHGENGGPPATMAPNQQQTADAKTEAKPDGTVVATASSSVKGVTAGPLSAIDAVSTATISENGNRKPVITSSASGRFSVGGMEVAFDKKGFRVLGQAVPASDGLKQINSILANANVKLTAVPSSTTVDKVSGATVYLIGGLQMTTTQTSPATAPATIDYIFARVAVSTVSVPEGDTSATKTPVVTDPAPAAPSGGGGLTPASGPAAAPAASSGDAPIVAADPVAPAGDTTPAAPADVAPPAVDTGGAEVAAPPTTLGSVQALGPPVTSESSLIYLALVLAGLASVVGSQLFRRFGVLLQLREGSGRPA